MLLSGPGKAQALSLLLPAAGQVRHSDELVGGEMRRLAPVEDGSGDVRRQEGELEDSRHMAFPATFALGDLSYCAGVAIA